MRLHKLDSDAFHGGGTAVVDLALDWHLFAVPHIRRHAHFHLHLAFAERKRLAFDSRIRRRSVAVLQKAARIVRAGAKERHARRARKRAPGRRHGRHKRVPHIRAGRINRWKLFKKKKIIKNSYVRKSIFCRKCMYICIPDMFL